MVFVLEGYCETGLLLTKLHVLHHLYENLGRFRNLRFPNAYAYEEFSHFGTIAYRIASIKRLKKMRETNRALEEGQKRATKVRKELITRAAEYSRIEVFQVGCDASREKVRTSILNFQGSFRSHCPTKAFRSVKRQNVDKITESNSFRYTLKNCID